MNLATYFWQVNVAWLLLYAVYWAFLRRDTFFRWNRFYLLAATLFAVVFPFLPVPTPFQDAVPKDEVLLFFGDEQQEVALTQVVKVEVQTLFTWENVLLSIYIIGAFILFIRLIINLFKIFKLVFPFLRIFTQKATIPSTQTIQRQENYFIINTKPETPIFSFLNILFWNENTGISEDEKAKILAHELVHIRQWHSLDVLFMELMTIVFWCNPIAWAYRKSLQAVHEYLADAKVLEMETSKTDYANLLVSQFLHTRTFYLTNHFFNKSLLKNRIMMMYQKKSNQKAFVKFALVVPVVAICLLIAAFNTKTETAEVNVQNVIPKKDDGSTSHSTAYLMYNSEDSEKPHFVGVLSNNMSQQLYTLTMPPEEEVAFSENFLKTAKLGNDVTSARRVYYHSIDLTIRKNGSFVEQRQYKNISWDDIKKYSQEGDEVFIEFNGTKVKNTKNEWVLIDSGIPFVRRIFPSFGLGGC